MSEWIKAQPDQLPPFSPEPHKHVECIVYIPGLDEGTVLKNGVTTGYYIHGLNEWRMTGSPSTWKVTYWQAMPQPPVTEEDDES
jgi:hypothetical protein